MTRICKECKVEKEITEFSKQKRNTYGYNYVCKKCKADYAKKYSKTKDGLIGVLYNTQKKSSRKRGHRPPEYSKQDFKDWCYSQKVFHELYEEWKQSKFNDRLKPSIDRKCDDIHYCMNNIQIVTWKENNEKALAMYCPNRNYGKEL